MILLFNHTLTQEQIEDARETHGVEVFVPLTEELQHLWSDIPPEIESVDGYLLPIREFVSATAVAGDCILVQGDFGATFAMVEFAHSLGLIPLYATTKRVSVDTYEEDKVIKKSLFKHIQFRRYHLKGAL